MPAKLFTRAQSTDCNLTTQTRTSASGKMKVLRRGTENTGAPMRSSAGEAPLPAYLAGQQDNWVSWVSVGK